MAKRAHFSLRSEYAKEAARYLKEVATRHSLRTTFWDFITLSFCAVSKQMATTQEEADRIEAEYEQTENRWGRDVAYNQFAKAMACIAVGYEKGERDHLGELAGALEILNADMGQFFTPMEVCRLMAEMTIGDVEQKLINAPRGFITVAEPAAGAGAMVLATADTLKARGHDPATSMWVEATELHHGTFQMCYLALSMAGVAGRVTHGNTLTGERFQSVLTVPAVRFINENGPPWKRQQTPRIRVRPSARKKKRVRPRP